MAYLYLLSFGSNLGRRGENLRRGFELLSVHGAFSKVSEIIETEPLPSTEFDVSDHDPYLNCVAEFHTLLSPRELYDAIRLVEDRVGHSRVRRWAPRELDVDILFCALGAEAASFASGLPLEYRGHEGLRIPHAGIWERGFLLGLIESGLGVSRAVLARHRIRSAARERMQSTSASPASQD